jgi:hypothetical protein
MPAAQEQGEEQQDQAGRKEPDAGKQGRRDRPHTDPDRQEG